MKKVIKILLICVILVFCAAIPVFAQTDSTDNVNINVSELYNFMQAAAQEETTIKETTIPETTTQVETTTIQETTTQSNIEKELIKQNTNLNMIAIILYIILIVGLLIIVIIIFWKVFLIFIY